MYSYTYVYDIYQMTLYPDRQSVGFLIQRSQVRILAEACCITFKTVFK